MFKIINLIYHFKDDAVARVGRSSNDTGASNYSGCQIINDVTIQIWHNHDIKLGRFRYQLHSCIIDNHFFEFDFRIKFSDLLDT